MDELLIPVGFLLLIFFVFVLPVMVYNLKWRVGRLEDRLREMEKARENAPDKDALVTPPPVVGEEKSAMERAKDQAREERVVSAPEAPAKISTPPPLPQVTISTTETPAPAPAVSSAPAPKAIPAPPAPDPITVFCERVFEWFEKVGLKPPKAGGEGANLIAWWSTRAGLALGVIAAVFFGLYVNQNTVPLVRLVELVAVAIGFFAGGWWMEKKLGTFGRALSAGGLALLYVAAYASYGLPAMKVVEAPLAGALVQVGAVGLMAGWAWWRRNEGVFALALGLGYVTSWFSYMEGVDPLPLISFLVLAGGGAAMFALRQWWSGLWAGLVGSSGGLLLLAVFRWQSDAGPDDVVGLGSACLLTIILVSGLYVQWRKGDPLVSKVLPLVTSVGVVVGAVVSGVLKIDWEWYYATYAVLLLLVGLLWRREGEGETMWEVMWAKASVFVALFLIAKFDGPVRAYGLLAQAGSLAFLARRKAWLVFDVGALLAAGVGWIFVVRELSSGVVPTWGADEFVVLGFLFGSLGLLAFFSKGERFPREREKIVTAIAALLALGVFWTAAWRVEHEWAVLAVLIAAGVFLAVGRVAKLWKSDFLGAVLLLPALVLLLERGVEFSSTLVEVSGIGWQSLVWAGAAWAYAFYVGRVQGKEERVLGMGVMIASIAAVVMAGHAFFGGDWVPVILLGLALLWQLADKFVTVLDLRSVSVVAALIGAIVFAAWWGREVDTSVLVSSVLLAIAYWGSGHFLAWEEDESGLAKVTAVARGGVLGAVLLTGMTTCLEETALAIGLAGLSAVLLGAWWRIRDQTLPWTGAVAAFLALVYLTSEGSGSGVAAGVVVLFCIFVFNGLFLARSGQEDALANAKVASVYWGILAMLTVLLGLTANEASGGGTTAFWAVGAVALLAAGFWGGLRGYRVVGLLGIGCAIMRLFSVDVQETFWRIVAFGVTGALLVGIGYIYNRFHQRLAEHDLDWSKEEAPNSIDP